MAGWQIGAMALIQIPSFSQLHTGIAGIALEGPGELDHHRSRIRKFTIPCI